MTIGIYIITLGDDNICYIGQSTNIEVRLRTHKRLLTINKHYNKKLQASYTGIFNASILEECSIEKLNSLEEIYINEFNSVVCGYNITSGGSSGGRGTEASKSIYTREILIDIFFALTNPDFTNKDIALMYNIPVSIVETIAYNKRHAWLSEEFPEVRIIIKNLISSNIRFKSSNNINKRNNVLHSLISPSGIINTFYSVRDFAVKNNLNPSHTCQVLRGLASQHKGWKLPKLTEREGQNE